VTNIKVAIFIDNLLPFCLNQFRHAVSNQLIVLHHSFLLLHNLKRLHIHDMVEEDDPLILELDEPVRRMTERLINRFERRITTLRLHHLCQHFIIDHMELDLELFHRLHSLSFNSIHSYLFSQFETSL